MFVDTIGFSSWSRRTGEDSQHFLNFMIPVNTLFSKIKIKHKCFMKTGADGIFAVFELGEGHNCKLVLRVLKLANCIVKRFDQILNQMAHPKPGGVRIRIHRGIGWSWNVPGFGPDYFSKEINTAKHLQMVRKDIPLMCTEHVSEMISPKQAQQAGLKFWKVKRIDFRPPNIDPEDLELLRGYFIKKSRNGK